jgi:hypothetical protein
LKKFIRYWIYINSDKLKNITKFSQKSFDKANDFQSDQLDLLRGEIK